MRGTLRNFAEASAGAAPGHNQIQVPGAAPPTSALASAKRSKTKPSKKAVKAPKSDASSSASDVESDSSDAIVVDLDPPLPLDLMPLERGSGAEFNSLVAAICRRPWLALSKIESAASGARCGVKQRSALALS